MIFKGYVLISVIHIFLRIAFALYYFSDAQGFSSSEFMKAFYLGLKFDSRMALVILLPLALISLAISPLKYTSIKKFWSIFYGAMLCLYIGGFYFDFAYYSYLQTRVNGSALKFMATPLISLQMMWESYPIIWATIISVIPGFIIYHIFMRWIFNSSGADSIPIGASSRKRDIKTKIIISALVTSLYVLGLYAKISQYPLRWSEAFFSNNYFITAMALNPWHYFADTYKVSKKSYSKKKVTEHYNTMADYLGVNNKDEKTLNFKRPLELTPLFKNKKPNVVLIIMESFAAHKSGSFGHPLSPTPYFDKLAEKGTLFTEFYTPSEGTARSIFTIISGVPDTTQYRTSSRNPLIVEQNTALKAFKGYEKFYFLGGSANWGEIRGVLQHNVPDLKMFEEGSYSSPSTDVWGISDYDLFKEARIAIEARNNQSEPFFALIQTSGFHRPYTIPEDHGDFELKSISSKQIKDHGFVNAEEYNALRFADYSLGKFIKSIKETSYFKNTIFVVLGDHGLPELKAKHVSKGFQYFGLERFHVPLLFYGPGLIEAKKIHTIATEPDVIPTLAGISNLNFTLTGIGRNLFAEKHNNNKMAFTYVYHSTPKIYHLMDEEFLIKGDTSFGAKGLYKYRSETPQLDVKNQFPEVYQNMKNLSEGYLETSRYLLYFNKE